MPKPRHGHEPVKHTGKDIRIPLRRLNGWHRVVWKPDQVERSLRPEAIKVGTRLAILDQRSASLWADGGEPIPEPAFYPGEVVKIYGDKNDPMMEIKFDGHPYALGVHCGVKQYARFCIALPVETRKALRRADDGAKT